MLLIILQIKKLIQCFSIHEEQVSFEVIRYVNIIKILLARIVNTYPVLWKFFW